MTPEHGQQTKPRVLVVGPFAETAGGILTFQINLTEKSDLKQRWRFIRFSTSRPFKTASVSNTSYIGAFDSGIRRFLAGLLVTLRNFARFPVVLARHHPAIVQIQSADHFVFWESMVYVLIARVMRCPPVLRFGGSFDAFYRCSGAPARFLMRRLISAPSGIVVQSESKRQFFADIGRKKDVHVMPNGVEIRAMPQRAGREGPARVVFICTTLASVKGIDLIVAAAPELRECARFTFVAATSGARRRIREAGLDDMATIHGVVPREQMREIYEQSDLFVLPSRSEGFPNSLLEAMAAGLPVVASRVGAVPEIVDDGVCGFLIEPDSLDRFVHFVTRLCNDAELRNRFGRAAYELVSERYELNRVFSAFDEIWSKACRK